MKKIFSGALIAILILFASITASAQKGYRGFVDFDFGIDAIEEASIAGILSTVHGYQYKNSFFGAGFGILASDNHYVSTQVNVPIFVQYRYDYSIFSKYSFFCKTKVGYEICMASPCGGIGAGIRWNLNRYSGITALNLGLNLLIRYDDRYGDVATLPSIGFGIEF